ncbi:hypothetical protein R1flu_009984 [Riccia fluitans]|uniref:Uncharacterized protein n=1 Tax=Riccia fluitans TaxID=41844 RepID=A0ABD1Z6Q1_9MARC
MGGNSVAALVKNQAGVQMPSVAANSSSTAPRFLYALQFECGGAGCLMGLGAGSITTLESGFVVTDSTQSMDYCQQWPTIKRRWNPLSPV